MRRIYTLAAQLLLIAALSACDRGLNPLEPGVPPPPAEGSQHEDFEIFLDAARIAWTYIDREYQPTTGWVNAVEAYPYTTIWDVGSTLAALFSARELGLLEDAEYHARVGRALATL